MFVFPTIIISLLWASRWSIENWLVIVEYLGGSRRQNPGLDIVLTASETAHEIVSINTLWHLGAAAWAIKLPLLANSNEAVYSSFMFAVLPDNSTAEILSWPANHAISSTCGLKVTGILRHLGWQASECSPALFQAHFGKALPDSSLAVPHLRSI